MRSGMGEVKVFIFLGLMSDLDLIRELEKAIGEKLEEVDEERFQFDSENPVYNNAYTLSSESNIIGLLLVEIKGEQLINFPFLKLKKLIYLNLESIESPNFTFVKELKRLTHLNLNDNQLTDVSFLKELKDLTHLDLNENRLTDVSFLKDLKGLTYLDLNENQLTDVSFLKNIKGLTHLDLSENELTDVSFLKDLKSLTHLDLSKNQLTDVSFLKELKGLTNLNLVGNQLTDASFLKELKDLTRLQLSWNQLTDISFLKELKGLTNLDLDYNNLTDVSSLKQLTGLTKLDLSSNQLTDISFLKELKGLTNLNLVGNQLTDISSLKDLTGLTNLNLSSNQLTDISSLNDLKDLTDLDLRFNQIKEIPLWLTEKGLEINLEFYGSNCIKLHDNPIETPPLEIAHQGNAAIRNYYAQIAAQGKDHLYEAKMLILGEGESGKTTLAHKIENPNCPLPHIDDRTRGITINRHPYSVKDKKNNQQTQTFHLNIWDFGGQEIYHATHRFFLSKRSLYLLVADNRKDDTDFNYWLNIIELFAGDSPLIILLNEKDDLKRSIDQSQLRSRYPHSIKEILAVNLKTYEETDSQKRQDRLKKINQLIRHIEHQAEFLPHIGEPVPARWLDVRQAIENDTRNQIYREQFDQLCHDSTITNPEDITTLLSYFHDLGIVLHFADKPHLANRVILRPDWATNAIYRLFDHDVIKAKQGRFSRKDCSTIWSDDQYRHLHDVLIELMKNFRLVYEIGNSGNLVAPRMLPSDTPAYPWDTTQNQLQFRYDFFMPKGIFEQLVVILYRYIENHDWVWRNGVILGRDGARAEIIENIFERRIYIRFVGKNITELRAIIIDELDAINRSYHKLNYEKMIPCCCDQCSSQSEPHFFKYSTLRKRQEKGIKDTIECEISEADVPIGSLLGSFNIHITDNFRENQPMKIIKIFLASSSELKGDREQFEIFINRKNKDYVNQGIFLRLELWEDFLDAISATRLQDEYNKVITDCDIFVSLFHSKVGKYTKEEFVTALATFRTHSKPWIYTYFKDEAVKLSDKNRDDIVSLYNFQEELKNLGHFHSTYDDIGDLKYKFSEQLIKILS